MSKFERGITNKKFIDKLNLLNADSNSYWHKMTHDKDLFIAIRKEAINVYYRGSSICELKFVDSRIIGRTHYKYLLKPDLGEYVEAIDGEFLLNSSSQRFLTSLNDLASIKRASLPYSGDEKAGVHSISLKDKNVIDVEIAISKPDSKTDRIDYLKLEEEKGNLKLVFHEAKHFKNAEIRAEKDPRVFEQIEKYIRTLKDKKIEMLQSYKLVCKNLFELNLIKSNKDNFIKRIAEGEPFSIDYAPRLIIFGFDTDQRDGKIWKEHHSTLIAKLGDRLILKAMYK